MYTNYTYMHTLTHIHVYTHAHTRTHKHVYIHSSTHTHANAHIQSVMSYSHRELSQVTRKQMMVKTLSELAKHLPYSHIVTSHCSYNLLLHTVTFQYDYDCDSGVKLRSLYLHVFSYIYTINTTNENNHHFVVLSK